MYQITLVAAQQHLSDKVFEQANILGLSTVEAVDACAVHGVRAVPLTHTERDSVPAPIDVFCRPAAAPAPRLFLADMDATMVKDETLDELAAKAGLKDAIKAITDRAMRGELDFEQALRTRVNLMKGLDIALLDQTKADMRLMEGATELLAALKAHKVTTVLVSGGFTQFTGYIAEKLGFDHHIGNTFEIDGNKLTGGLIPPIIDKAVKKNTLLSMAQKLGCSLDQTITIGDGANDVDMLQAAGFGIGFQPKPIVADQVTNLIRHGDLKTLLYPLGWAGR